MTRHLGHLATKLARSPGQAPPRRYHGSTSCRSSRAQEIRWRRSSKTFTGSFFGGPRKKIIQGQGSPTDRANALLCAERWDEARRAYEQLAAEKPDEWSYQAQLGIIAARTGEREKALRISDQLATLDVASTRNDWWPIYNRACIAAVLGDREQSIALIHEAIEQGFWHFDHMWRDMDLESLRDYPPFKELIRPKG